MDMLVGIGAGALAGAVYGLTGYFKNKKQEDMFEGFNSQQFSISVVGSAVCGAMASYTGASFDAVSAGAFGVVIYQVISNIFKSIFKTK
jgi:hypothetical protein